jgi:hypothetical protein
MTNTETIKTALIKQIIDSGSNIPLSVLVGNIDLLINTAKAEQCITISDKVIGSHITEPELKVEDLKAGEWYFADLKSNDSEKWVLRFKSILDDYIHVYCCASLNTNIMYGSGELCSINKIKSIRPATIEEIIKYFPHEFEVDTHGGNDIPQVTDPHL